MKSTILYTATLSCFFLFACNKLLDVKPNSFSSGNNYYNTEEQILRAVNGCYGTLQSLYTSDFWAMTEMRADNTNYQYDESDRGAQQREEIDEFLITPSNNYINSVWAQLYYNIQQTNVIISRIDNVKFKSDATKAQYLSEAKFLRGFYYFHLVRLFGSVPLKIKEVTGPEDAATAKKATVDEIYSQIIADATDAANNLPSSFTGANKGRATKGAALTLLGEVYLTRKDYPKAVSTLQEVTKLNYILMQEYGDYFDPAKKSSNTEAVFEVQYNSGLETESSNFIFMFGPRNGKKDLTGFNGNLGGNNIPTPSIVNAYEPNDKRKAASISMYDSPTNASFAESIAFGGKIPFIKKFYHPPYALDGRANENWPVYRYAQVLLMLAEAINESGTGDPYPYLNLVRQRAGLDGVGGLSQPALRDTIFHETRVELAFEDNRWYQLLRTGKAISVMTQHGIDEKKRLTRLSPASYNIKDYQLLYPLPERECRLNGFDQNEGW
ncbi:RagB/SusD family nutrient uptake outer membrane protein [Chitinophaga silvatica]|uniref:RagB/SusD family nutrient uptake outer membrane protein n=1 Tax=Chitinophaga silvatica TaxID=2282649 RepID=A0A3E1Y2N1_9BACT|nr:RagB/SusD family nutrient uptake outer membrane protein [Chitinophaga silvatica]RFS18921.1 RagB/SusD family nutrient uptake outer membrane protein [Chitinophaga silvatica]